MLEYAPSGASIAQTRAGSGAGKMHDGQQQQQQLSVRSDGANAVTSSIDLDYTHGQGYGLNCRPCRPRCPTELHKNRANSKRDLELATQTVQFSSVGRHGRIVDKVPRRFQIIEMSRRVPAQFRLTEARQFLLSVIPLHDTLKQIMSSRAAVDDHYSHPFLQVY